MVVRGPERDQKGGRHRMPAVTHGWSVVVLCLSACSSAPKTESANAVALEAATGAEQTPSNAMAIDADADGEETSAEVAREAREMEPVAALLLGTAADRVAKLLLGTGSLLEERLDENTGVEARLRADLLLRRAQRACERLLRSGELEDLPVSARRQRLSTALDLIDEAARLVPQTPAVYFTRGLYWMLLMDGEKAGILWEKGSRLILAENPSSALAHGFLGLALSLQNRKRGAIASHRRALELDANHTRSHLELGGLLEEIGETKDALAAYQAAHEAHLRNGDAALARLARMRLELLTVTSMTAEDHAREYSIRYAQSCQELNAKEPEAPTPDRDRFGARGLSREDIIAVVSSHDEEIASCYSQALPGWPDAEGRVVMLLRILHDGTVGEVSVMENETRIQPLPCCMFEAIKEWRFGRTHQRIDLVNPWVFEQPSDSE